MVPDVAVRTVGVPVQAAMSVTWWSVKNKSECRCHQFNVQATRCSSDEEFGLPLGFTAVKTALNPMSW